jgi:hypothetical protein
MGKRGPKPLFGKPLTNAECIARWRAKHARRLARKPKFVPGPILHDDLVGIDMDWFDSELAKQQLKEPR